MHDSVVPNSMLALVTASHFLEF